MPPFWQGYGCLQWSVIAANAHYRIVTAVILITQKHNTMKVEKICLCKLIVNYTILIVNHTTLQAAVNNRPILHRTDLLKSLIVSTAE